MGGGNGQKSYHDRLAKQKKLAAMATKCPEARKAAREAATKYWCSEALLCGICKTGFMIHTDAQTLRQHAANKHPDKDRFQCFPALESLEEQEAEGAAKMAAQLEAEQAAAEAAKLVAKERKAAETPSKRDEEKKKTGDLNGVAGWTSLAKSGGYAQEAVAVAAEEPELVEAEPDEEETQPGRYRAATAEALKAAFIKACAEVEDLEEGVADEDLLEAVADEMARVLEEHQTDGWEDGSVCQAEIEESVEPLLSCVLNEDQTLQVICAVLEPLSIDDDKTEE